MHEAEQVIQRVLRDLRDGTHRGVVVDSPPGAGKSTLVVRAAVETAATGDPLMIVAQTNEQVDDLIDRLGRRAPELRVGRLSATDYRPTERVTAHPAVRVAAKVADLGGPAVTIGTAAKWATVTEGSWPWAIVDEAYQMRADALLRVAGRFERALFVGDPGQLDPFSTVETFRWTGLTWDPMQSAVATLLRHNPELPVHRLPVSWRLPDSAAPVVSAAFYPFTGFRAGTGPSDRALTFTEAGAGDAYDASVEVAAATGWALHELPARHTVRTDGEAAAACAELALRVLRRGAVAVSEAAPGGAPVTADRIAVGAAHRDQVAAIRSRLGAAGAGITVDTANRLQGREYDVTIVLHPLSGRRDATAFHLESGRLCVLASRHRHACVVVARAGIGELLDAYPSTERVHLDVPVKFPDGWEANQTVLTHLDAHRAGRGVVRMA
ncbi:MULTISPECIES: AAA family ATPase [Micromonospora]|uniref:AAA family ATPase n=1 Tax=Micromonospora aurantiaca (nom. illeg.) TaxID=47850 RepID=A0A1C6T1Z6_9ACTN|nr:MULTISPECIES: AAA family ATPase [Micromonospora]AXH90844.1 helicase [Micromonospora aurantiaca]KAB1108120.1 AAA family ATPase [Micromonospora aurantiaca]MBC9000902.1 ATP-binding protein [Micromonospora aurantiaca]UFN95663.1 AAA family ATPase [Micromonospora aurantiaca]SCL35573.1 Part of AAA domain-containing protein [Micromonospora aurantiaca]